MSVSLRVTRAGTSWAFSHPFQMPSSLHLNYNLYLLCQEMRQGRVPSVLKLPVSGLALLSESRSLISKNQLLGGGEAQRVGRLAVQA